MRQSKVGIQQHWSHIVDDYENPRCETFYSRSFLVKNFGCVIHFWISQTELRFSLAADHHTAPICLEDVKVKWKCVLVTKSKKETDFVSEEQQNSERFTIDGEDVSDLDEIKVEATVVVNREVMIRNDEEKQKFLFPMEMHYLDKCIKAFHDKKASGSSHEVATPIMLDCQGSYVFAEKSVLMNESSYFESRFGDFWDNVVDEDLAGVYIIRFLGYELFNFEHNQIPSEVVLRIGIGIYMFSFEASL